VNRFNTSKNRPRRKKWYESIICDWIHIWYDSEYHESKQTAWNITYRGRRNDWYESPIYESIQAPLKKNFAKQKEAGRPFDI